MSKDTGGAGLDMVASWLHLFIGTGLDVGIKPVQMLNALKPKKLEQAIQVIQESERNKEPA